MRVEMTRGANERLRFEVKGQKKGRASAFRRGIISERQSVREFPFTTRFDRVIRLCVDLYDTRSTTDRFAVSNAYQTYVLSRLWASLPLAYQTDF